MTVTNQQHDSTRYPAQYRMTFCGTTSPHGIVGTSCHTLSRIARGARDAEIGAINCVVACSNGNTGHPVAEGFVVRWYAIPQNPALAGRSIMGKLVLDWLGLKVGVFWLIREKRMFSVTHLIIRISEYQDFRIYEKWLPVAPSAFAVASALAPRFLGSMRWRRW